MKSQRVTVRMGYKVNMGNYETMDIDFAVSADVEEGQSRSEAFEEVYEWVSDRLGREIKEANQASRATKAVKR